MRLKFHRLIPPLIPTPENLFPGDWAVWSAKKIYTGDDEHLVLKQPVESLSGVEFFDRIVLKPMERGNNQPPSLYPFGAKVAR